MPMRSSERKHGDLSCQYHTNQLQHTQPTCGLFDWLLVSAQPVQWTTSTLHSSPVLGCSTTASTRIPRGTNTLKSSILSNVSESMADVAFRRESDWLNDRHTFTHRSKQTHQSSMKPLGILGVEKLGQYPNIRPYAHEMTAFCTQIVLTDAVHHSSSAMALAVQGYTLCRTGAVLLE